jgi:hypothetical protein
VALLTPTSTSFKELAARVPAPFDEMTIIAGTNTVFLPASSLDMHQSYAKISGDPQIEPTFRKQVCRLVELMYLQHKVVLWLTPSGNRRTFAQQAAEKNTFAGPGESNHNFGRAVDIGFRGFNWINRWCRIVKDTDWLNRLTEQEPQKANKLWDARDRVALKQVMMFRLQFERVHLQAFNQATVSSGRSLARLMSTVGAMKWEAHAVAQAVKGSSKPHKSWHYSADFALGGKKFPVGTSKQIWSGHAAVTKTILAQAWTQKGGKIWKDTDIAEADLHAARNALKADFVKADQQWKHWRPVP